MNGLHVQADDLTKRLRTRRGDGLIAVEGVNADIRPGEFVGLSGPSGSGKTTLVALLAGLDHPTRGRVRWDGVDLGSLGSRARTELARATGVVFQNTAVIRRLPVWENVAYALVPLGVPPRERFERATAALDRVGIADLALRRPVELSSGERQRVAVARALLLAPRLLVADEPTSSLDADSAAAVLATFSDLHQSGCTVIVSSHDPVVLDWTQRIIRLVGGRLVGRRLVQGRPSPS